YTNTLDQGITTANTQLARMPLPATAGNQSNVKLRFVYDGLYYFWQLDDIRIVQGYANDLLIENSSYGDFDFNNPDHTTGFEMMEYTQYPSVFAPLVHFKSNVFNLGTNVQTNVALNARLIDDNSGALLFESNSPILSALAPGADSVLVAGEFQIDPTVSHYSAYFNGLQTETDGNIFNQIDWLQFDVTPITYARDKNSLGSMFLPSGAYADAPFEMGAVYLLPSSGQQLHSVSVAIGEGTTLPSSVYATIFPFSLATGIGAAIATTQDFAITQADINTFGGSSMKVLSFDTPVNLSQGLYLVAVGSPNSAFQAVIGLSGKSEDLSAWVRFNNSNTDLFYLTRTPMIRMNFGVVSEVTEQSFGQEFQLYPNPASESLSILLNEKESALIEIFDQTGRRVHSEKSNAQVLKIEMNVSQFSTGIYTVKVIQANHSSSQIFIKE
ncbi:MAG: T9SS type A sorting domain-containing protein, partial [Sediminibacterium sp.]